MHPTPTAIWPICTLCARLHLHLCTHHSIAQRARISLLSLANGFAPPWPQLIILGTFETFTMCSRRWSISFWPTSSFLPSDFSRGMSTVYIGAPVGRQLAPECERAHIFLFLGFRMVELGLYNVFMTITTPSDTNKTTPRRLGSSGLRTHVLCTLYEAHLTDPTTLPCHTVASPRLLYSPFQALYCADPMARRQRSSSELSSSAALHRTRQHGSARSQQASFGRRGASNTCDGPHGDGCSSSAAGRAQEV